MGTEQDGPAGRPRLDQASLGSSHDREEHVGEALHRAERLYELAVLVSGPDASTREVLDRGCRFVCDALRGSAVALTLLDADRVSLRRAAHAGLPAEWLAREQPPSPRMVLAVRDLGDQVLELDLRTFADTSNGPLYVEYDVRRCLAAALRNGGEVVGAVALLVFGEDRAFTPAEGKWLSAAASVLGQAVVRLQLIDQLRERERSYRAVVEHGLEGIWTVDAAGQTTFANERLAGLLGYTPRELLGRPLTAFFAPSARRAPSHGDAESEHGFLDALLGVFQRPESERGPALAEFGRRARGERETRLLRKDGTVLTVLASGTLVHDDEGRFLGATALVTDLTPVIALQARVAEAQRTEQLALLAGGIAHDFNNLLVGILGNAGFALAEVPQPSPLREAIDEIETAAMRAAELTRQILAFSGRQPPIVAPVSVNGIVTEMVRLLGTAAGARITLRLELDAQVPQIEGDVTQLRQVVMNLLTNARDAIGDRDGVVTVRTGRRPARETARHELWPGGQSPTEGYVIFVEVTDTGVGMSDETRERIFEPYFTTKPTGRGLGLAAVLGILRAHDAGIAVESEAGHGSTFRVLLAPMAERRVTTRPPPARPPPREPVRGSGLVLLVDDDEQVRNVARRVLQRAGYEVHVAPDGVDAVALFAANPTGYACVVTDSAMPRMSGYETIHRIRQIRPDMPILLSSGFEDLGGTVEIEAAQVDFVAKPWTPSRLVEAVARIAVRSERRDG